MWPVGGRRAGGRRWPARDGQPSNLDTHLLCRYAVGASVAIHAFRRDELMTFTAVLQGDRVPGVSLSLLPAPKKATGPKRP
jgi:predicted metalloprotease with PDZ domain